MSQETLLIVAAVFLTGWVFAVGASLGSFLNVLVWRMPLGKPLVYARSHCPKCEFAIPARDNLPILGWLLLKGKCRGCGQSISIRYPLVEFAVAFLFAILFLLEVVGHGVNLPNWFENHSGNWLTELMECELLIVFIQHCILMYFMLAFALIDFDGERVPTRLLIIAIVCGLLLSMFAPELNPNIEVTKSFLQNRLNVMQADIIGTFAGIVAGLLFSQQLRELGAWRMIDDSAAVSGKSSKREKNAPEFAAFAAFSLIGLHLGWEAVIIISWFTLIVGMISVLSKRHLPRSWPIVFSVAWFVFGWHWIDYALNANPWIVSMGPGFADYEVLTIVGIGLLIFVPDLFLSDDKATSKPTDSSPDD